MLSVGQHTDCDNIFRAAAEYIIHKHFVTPQNSVKDSGGKKRILQAEEDD